MNRNHSGRTSPWLLWPSSSPSTSTSQTTIFPIATSASTDNNTAASTSAGRTGRARGTASSQEIFILLFIAFTVVHPTVFHGLVHILRHVAYSTKYRTSQGKLALMQQHSIKSRNLFNFPLSFGMIQVDLPNHTTSRRSVRDLSHKETVDKVNILTEFVMSQIEDFKEKYL